MSLNEMHIVEEISSGLHSKWSVNVNILFIFKVLFGKQRPDT